GFRTARPRAPPEAGPGGGRRLRTTQRGATDHETPGAHRKTWYITRRTKEATRGGRRLRTTQRGATDHETPGAHRKTWYITRRTKEATRGGRRLRTTQRGATDHETPGAHRKTWYITRRTKEATRGGRRLRTTQRGATDCDAHQRLEYWGAFLAFFRPAFLRSIARASRVSSPAFFSGGRLISSSTALSARATPSRS